MSNVRPSSPRGFFALAIFGVVAVAACENTSETTSSTSSQALVRVVQVPWDGFQLTEVIPKADEDADWTALDQMTDDRGHSAAASKCPDRCSLVWSSVTCARGTDPFHVEDARVRAAAVLGNDKEIISDFCKGDGSGATTQISCACTEDDPPACGDGKCNGSETCATCEQDCGSCGNRCGDGSCGGDESCSSCPTDCGACGPSCGDGQCNGTETCDTCQQDCGSCGPRCGDGQCNGTETCSSCPQDCHACAARCGDGVCDGGEGCQSCPQDCGACQAVCGNGTCEAGESCSSCPNDCGLCQNLCGNGICEASESFTSCPADCGGQAPCVGIATAVEIQGGADDSRVSAALGVLCTPACKPGAIRPYRSGAVVSYSTICTAR
jgi:hypothetical protein